MSGNWCTNPSMIMSLCSHLSVETEPTVAERIVYTDGACRGNPGPGGWAWAVPDGPFASGAAPRTTNQRMEITAVLEAVRSLPGRLEVRSDSTYVVNCFRDRWWEGWEAKDWKNSQRKPVANQDLWKPLIELYKARPPGELRFVWVKGHSGDPMNDIVDLLAVEASATQEARSGDRTPAPAEFAAADVAHGRDSRLPDGRLVLITGAKPPALGGYGSNPLADTVREKLADILAAKQQLAPELAVVTGLLLGAEQLGAEAASAAGVPYVAVLPYPSPDAVWPAESRRRFDALVGGAAVTIQLERKKPASKQQAGAALARRDGWLARQVDEAIVVWDGEDGAVGKTVRSLRDHLGEEEVWLVEPG
jgi:ribonuclease HI